MCPMTLTMRTIVMMEDKSNSEYEILRERERVPNGHHIGGEVLPLPSS